MNDQPGRLWAPWRLEYINSAVREPEGCFLCEAFNSSADREHLVLYRTPLAFAVMNLFPYNNGHLLIAPNRHLAGLDDLSSDELSAVAELTRTATHWINRAYQPHGYNIGLNLGQVAGAGLPGHLHFHIVPRWNGDTNFMPVLGCVKVVSEGLQASYDRIYEVIRELDAGGS